MLSQPHAGEGRCTRPCFHVSLTGQRGGDFHLQSACLQSPCQRVCRHTISTEQIFIGEKTWSLPMSTASLALARACTWRWRCFDANDCRSIHIYQNFTGSCSNTVSLKVHHATTRHMMAPAYKLRTTGSRRAKNNISLVSNDDLNPRTGKLASCDAAYPR